MGKFGKQLQKTLHKVQHKFVPHNSYVNLEDEDALPSNVPKDIVPSDVPEGSFVVYVGDERRRFVIKTKILECHLFQDLLTWSNKKFGYNPDGPLIMDCDVLFFKHLIWFIETWSPSV